MNRLRSLISIPDFGDFQLNVRGAILNTFLLVAWLGVATFIIFRFVLSGFSSQAPVSLLVLVMLTIALFVLHRGHLQAASIAFLCGVWLIITVRGLTSSGVYAPGVVFYLVIIVLTAMLLNERYSLLAATVSSLAMLLMAFRETAGYLPEHAEAELSPYMIWVLNTLAFYLTAVFMWVYVRLLQKSWEQTREAQNQAEVQRAELAQTREKAKIINDLLRDINHDLKTPLAVINTSLYFLERGDDPEMRRERIRRIEEQTRLVQQYFEDTLAISQIDHTPEVPLTSLDLNALLHSVGAHLRPRAEHKHQTLTLETPKNPLHIRANATELYRAIANLAENAVNYTPENGRITLRTHSSGSSVMIEVIDSGLGIDQADQPYIFDRYYRGKSAHDSGAAGTGLGLAIVKKIAELHGGTVEVESIPGQGSTFRIYLPFSPEKIHV